MNTHPDIIVIEPTTRCNLNCTHCMKHASGSRLAEGDIDRRVFDAAKELFPDADRVMFTGIGEPLLNSRVESFIAEARELMPTNGIIGLQTNGMLLTPSRAIRLLEAGVNRICVSVDSLDSAGFQSMRNGGTVDAVQSAITTLRRLKQACGDRSFEFGIQAVLTKQTLAGMPELIRWAGDQGAGFAIISHLTPYHSEAEDQVAFLPNSDRALDLFNTWIDKAGEQGISFEKLRNILWKYDKSPGEKELVRLVQAMKTEAARKDIFMDVESLLGEDPALRKNLSDVFTRIRSIAEKKGIRLILPAERPTHVRHCRFIEDNAMFVAWNGDVSPCYFLWHGCTSMRKGFQKTVAPKFFGNVLDTPPLKIWRQEHYARFRRNVLKYDYPFCSNCNLPPCSYILDAPFVHDCYSIEVPCCDCGWSQGLYHCLL